MSACIKVFVKGEWIAKPFASESRAWAWYGQPPEHRLEKLITRKDFLAVRVAEQVATEQGLRLKLYDLAHLRGWILGQVYRVKTTPTIIVGSLRFEGLPSREELTRFVGDCKKQDRL